MEISEKLIDKARKLMKELTRDPEKLKEFQRSCRAAFVDITSFIEGANFPPPGFVELDTWRLDEDGIRRPNVVHGGRSARHPTSGIKINLAVSAKGFISASFSSIYPDLNLKHCFDILEVVFPDKKFSHIDVKISEGIPEIPCVFHFIHIFPEGSDDKKKISEIQPLDLDW